jgi:hypothetical protein
MELRGILAAPPGKCIHGDRDASACARAGLGETGLNVVEVNFGEKKPAVSAPAVKPFLRRPSQLRNKNRGDVTIFSISTQ